MKLLPNNKALHPGDIFCTVNPMALGKAINGVQKIWATDSEATYSHSGIILDENGTTLEALWTVKRQNLFNAYFGKQVLIGRLVTMDYNKFITSLNRVKKHEGQWYPFYRLALFMLPAIAKIHIAERLVCSELTWKFIDGENYAGINPDTVADRIRNWRKFEVIYEGSLIC